MQLWAATAVVAVVLIVYAESYWGAFRMRLVRTVRGLRGLVDTLLPPQAKLWSVVMMSTIVLSSVAFVVQTLPAFYYDEYGTFGTLELVCVIFFTVEYVLRFICSPLPNEKPQAPGEDDEDDEEAKEDVKDEALNLGARPPPLNLDTPRPPTTLRDVVHSRAVFMLGYMNIVDLLAIFPFYLEAIITATRNGEPPEETTGLAFVRVIRITRVFRLLKLGRHNDGMQILLLTLEESASFLMSVLFLVLIIQVLFGAIVFFTEVGVGCQIQYMCEGGQSTGRDCTLLTYNNSEVKNFSGSVAEMHLMELMGLNNTWLPVPISSSKGDWCGEGSECLATGNLCFRHDGRLSKFNSIPAAMWWTLVSMCCVGFGDMAPLDEWGKLVGAVTAITGVIVLAMPTTVIGTNFSEIYEAYYERKASDGYDDDGEGNEVDEIQGANSKHLNRLIVSKQLAAKAKTEGMPDDMIEKALHQESRDELGAKQIFTAIAAQTKELSELDAWSHCRTRAMKASSALAASLVKSYYMPPATTDIRTGEA